MIKVEEIAEKYKGYEMDEEKLKEFLVPPKPTTVWDLKDGDPYWYLESEGTITLASWCENTVSKRKRAHGNVFLTKEDAEFEVMRRKVEATLLKYGRRGFKYSEDNYYIYYEHDESSIEIGCYESVQDQGVIYFDTEELCQKAMIAAGEKNIKKYIFGVKD